MANRLILDTDGGVDDAQALMLLIAGGRAPDVITTVFGNVEPRRGHRNVLATLAVAGATSRSTGRGPPLAQDMDPRPPCPWRGRAGRRAAPARTAESPDRTPSASSRHAVGGAATADPVDLLMIGPLTNLALALQRAPGIAGGIGRLTIMGGTVYGRGNVTPAAEFNIFSDPEAAAIVFAAAVDTTVVPWESCLAHAHGGRRDRPDVRARGRQRYKAFAQALVQHDRDTAHPQRPGRSPSSSSIPWPPPWSSTRLVTSRCAPRRTFPWRPASPAA